MRRWLQKAKGLVEFDLGRYRKETDKVQSPWSWDNGIFAITILDTLCQWCLWLVLVFWHVGKHSWNFIFSLPASKGIGLSCRKLGKDCVFVFDIKLYTFPFMLLSVYFSLESFLGLLTTTEFTRCGCIEAGRFTKGVWKIN